MKELEFTKKFFLLQEVRALNDFQNYQIFLIEIVDNRLFLLSADYYQAKIKEKLIKFEKNEFFIVKKIFNYKNI